MEREAWRAEARAEREAWRSELHARSYSGDPVVSVLNLRVEKQEDGGARTDETVPGIHAFIGRAHA